jgi:hypothetical protein
VHVGNLLDNYVHDLMCNVAARHPVLGRSCRYVTRTPGPKNEATSDSEYRSGPTPEPCDATAGSAFCEPPAVRGERQGKRGQVHPDRQDLPVVDLGSVGARAAEPARRRVIGHT